MSAILTGVLHPLVVISTEAAEAFNVSRFMSQSQQFVGANVTRRVILAFDSPVKSRKSVQKHIREICSAPFLPVNVTIAHSQNPA